METGWPKHEAMTFHKGLVTNGKGEPSQTDAYLSYGSAHGENPEDAEIVISGGGAAKAATAIEAIPDMLALLEATRITLKNRDQDEREAKLLLAIQHVIAKATTDTGA